MIIFSVRKLNSVTDLREQDGEVKNKNGSCKHCLLLMCPVKYEVVQRAKKYQKSLLRNSNKEL